MKNLKQQKAGMAPRNYDTAAGMSILGPRSRWTALFVFLFGLLCSICSICAAQPASQPQGDTLRLCFLSDTQEPMFFERVVLAYNQNAGARATIFEEILRLNPKGVIHCGDEISLGSSDGAWEEIDEFVRRLRGKGIEFSPAPGNHEYLLTSKSGIARFKSRYPYAQLTGYSRRYGNIGVVLINSNFGELSDEEQTGQRRWFDQTLSEMDEDSAIDYVVVGGHHPPFTNSKIVGSSEEIRDQYLPAFYKSTKSILWLSGHSHAFEHFRTNGKDFLVLGGSGGLQHTLSLGSKAEFHDVFSDTLEKRMFHFLSAASRGDTLEVDLKMLRPDFKDFETMPQLIFVRGSMRKPKVSE